MPSGTKAALAVVGQDLSHEFNQRYAVVKQQIEQVKQENLEGADRMIPAQLTAKCDELAQSFATARNDLGPRLTPQVAAVKQKSTIFIAVAAGLILLGIILLVAVNPMVGIIMALVGAGAFMVGNKIAESDSNKLEGEWRGLFTHYEGLMGEGETYQSNACGLYAEVDALYLKSLPDVERGTVLNMRGQAKSMQAQQAMMKQQAEAAAIQQQQMAAMQKQLGKQNKAIRKLR